MRTGSCPTGDMGALVGSVLKVQLGTGETVVGRLVSYTARSWWLVVGDEDRFCADVVACVPVKLQR